RPLPRACRVDRPVANERPRPVDVRRSPRHGRPLRPELVPEPRPAAARAHTSSAIAPSRDCLNGLLDSLDVRRVDEPLRVGVVGLGYWGPNIVRVLHDLGETEVAWVCDLREESLGRLTRRYPVVRATTDYERILADDTVDALVR